MPKEGKKTNAETKKLYQEGCAPTVIPVEPINVKPVVPPPQDIRETLADQIVDDIKLPLRLPIYTVKEEVTDRIEEKVIFYYLLYTLFTFALFPSILFV